MTTVTRVADKAADKVTDLKEVKNATVIVAGNSAYVAVVLTNGQKRHRQPFEK